VFINYDANDRIKRIGLSTWLITVSALEQVGGLQIIYNPRGQIVDIVGSVNGFQDFEPIQINRDNDYEYETHEAAIMRLLVTKRLQRSGSVLFQK
jgi:hypothetical protein